MTDAHAQAQLAWIKATAAQASSMAEFGFRFGPVPAAAASEDEHPARMERGIEEEIDVFERTRGDVWRDIFAGG